MPEIHDPLPLTIEGRIRDIIDQVIDESDAFLVELALRGRHGARVVEIFLDSDEGLPVEKIASFSRRIAFQLESEEVIRGHYSLSVSSPGASRPLLLPRQYAKHVGRLLAVTLLPDAPDAESSQIVGELSAVGVDSISIRPAGSEAVDLPFVSIKEAIVQLPW
jgi:ribosome maturation factor RimP